MQAPEERKFVGEVYEYRYENSAGKKWGVIARHLLGLVKGRFIELVEGNSGSGATHRELETAQSVAYIVRVFSDYLQYWGQPADGLLNKRVLEIGPGDSLGVALLFIAHGARQVVCLDRFRSAHDARQHCAIYSVLRDHLTENQRSRFDDAVKIEDGRYRLNPERVRYVYGEGIETAGRILPGEQFDLILSRAVLQETTGARAAFASMDTLMAPGGFQLHKIDLRDYGLFSRRGFHPLEFLTISDAVYDTCLRRHHPNRERIDAYRAQSAGFDYDSRIYATHTLASGTEIIPHVLLSDECDNLPVQGKQIEQIRPRLLKRFGQLSTAELNISGIFIVSQKVMHGLNR